MQMASTSGTASSSLQLSSTFGMPNSSATTLADARERFTTCVTSTPSCFCSSGMWNFLVFAP